MILTPKLAISSSIFFNNKKYMYSERKKHKGTRIYSEFFGWEAITKQAISGFDLDSSL